MGLNVSYRHFGNQAAAVEDAKRERETEGRAGEERERERGNLMKQVRDKTL